MNQKRAAIAGRTAWRRPAAWETVCRRASGRRRYNARRKLNAAMRRHEVERLLVAEGLGLFTWGTQAEIARCLGVHRSTVSRDMRRFLGELSPREFRLTYRLLQCLGRPFP
jgi:DNA-binding CsgD family transcriptional regulator